MGLVTPTDHGHPYLFTGFPSSRDFDYINLVPEWGLISKAKVALFSLV